MKTVPELKKQLQEELATCLVPYNKKSLQQPFFYGWKDSLHPLSLILIGNIFLGFFLACWTCYFFGKITEPHWINLALLITVPLWFLLLFPGIFVYWFVDSVFVSYEQIERQISSQIGKVLRNYVGDALGVAYLELEALPGIEITTFPNFYEDSKWFWLAPAHKGFGMISHPNLLQNTFTFAYRREVLYAPFSLEYEGKSYTIDAFSLSTQGDIHTKEGKEGELLVSFETNDRNQDEEGLIFSFFV